MNISRPIKDMAVSSPSRHLSMPPTGRAAVAGRVRRSLATPHSPPNLCFTLFSPSRPSKHASWTAPMRRSRPNGAGFSPSRAAAPWPSRLLCPPDFESILFGGWVGSSWTSLGTIWRDSESNSGRKCWCIWIPRIVMRRPTWRPMCLRCVNLLFMREKSAGGRLLLSCVR